MTALKEVNKNIDENKINNNEKNKIKLFTNELITKFKLTEHNQVSGKVKHIKN